MWPGVWFLLSSTMFSKFLRDRTINQPLCSLYEDTMFCFSTHRLMNIWAVSIFWLLWIMMGWTFTYKLLFEHLFSVLLSIYLGRELPGHMEMLFSFLRLHQTAYHSSKGLVFCFKNIFIMVKKYISQNLPSSPFSVYSLVVLSIFTLLWNRSPEPFHLANLLLCTH